MAFVAAHPALTPRLRRDALRPAVCRAPPSPAARGALRRAAVRAAAPQQVSAEELEGILKASPGPLLSVFSARCLVPQLEALAERMQDKIRIVKIDTDDYAEYATTIGVRGLPSLYFIQDGKLKHKMEGAETADNLAKLVDHFFFDGPAPEAPQVPTV